MARVLVWGWTLLMLAGCAKGPAGPTGPQGAPGTGVQSFQVEFAQGLYPDNGYTGVDCHWVDGGAPATAPGTGEIRVATGSTTSSLSLGLIRFDLSYGIPTNAIITAASLQLTTRVATSLSPGTYVFGVHQIIPPPAGQVPWNDSSSWEVLVAPYGWDGGSSSPITAGVDYSASPMDAVTVTASGVDSEQVLFSWNISPTLAQAWVNGSNDNYGVLLSPEPETNETQSGFISFFDDTGDNQQEPKMLVSYTVP